MSALLFLYGSFLLSIGLAQLAVATGTGTGSTGTAVDFNDYYLRQAVCQLYVIIEGSFGALIMAVSGLAAIISAAIGGYKTAISCIVVSLGCWVLRPMVTLYFGDIFAADGGGCDRGNPTDKYIKVATGVGLGPEK